MTTAPSPPVAALPECGLISNQDIDNWFNAVIEMNEGDNDDSAIAFMNKIRAQAKLVNATNQLPDEPMYYDWFKGKGAEKCVHENDYKALLTRASALISENQRLKETNGEITLEFCKQMDAQIALTSAAEASAQSAMARVAEVERDALVLAQVAYKHVCGSNGIFDNTWRNKDGGEVVPDFPHGGFSESINALGKALEPFYPAIDAALKA